MQGHELKPQYWGEKKTVLGEHFKSPTFVSQHPLENESLEHCGHGHTVSVGSPSVWLWILAEPLVETFVGVGTS